MSSEKKTVSTMDKIAGFIVDKRKAFYLVFLAAVIFCGASINKVVINSDITSYLPADTETRRGLTLMDEEFTTLASANVMVSNITYDHACQLSDQLSRIEGVDSVTFDDSEDHYRDASALFNVSFDGEDGTPAVTQATQAVQDALAGYDSYITTSAGQYDSATLMKEMSYILLIAAVVIVAVLLFTSKSYLEVVVFLIVFVVSAILNMGTNYWFGSISFITNAIAVVLQLALAIDYAIIFCHRYMEERDNGLSARDADVTALSKAIVEISSSSLTTISGLVALMLMQLRIGLDMGLVLSKGIICSMLTVFLLMPGLLMLFNRGIERTRHKNFVPRISLWGKAVVKTRFVLPVIFAVIVVCGIYCSNRCDYVFSTNSTNSGNKPAYRIAMDKMDETFGYNNTIAVLVPRGDYDREGAVLRRIQALPGVKSALGLANIEVEEGRMLTDKTSPRQFAELAGVDIELARLLYQAYGLSVEEYGAIFQDPDSYSVPLLDVFQFLLEQKDKGVVNLSGDQAAKVEELQDTLDAGLSQLQGEHWSRLVFTADLPEESEETYALLDQMRSIAAEYYGDNVVLVGNSTNARDLSDSFSGDNMKISVFTVLFVMVILLFTFKSAGLPVLLVLTIQGSIWINFSFPYLTHTNLFFLSYLIVSAIQMGATIDYAIVITNRYLELKQFMGRREAVIESLNQSFPTVFTSGTIMTVAGFLIGKLSTDSIISSIGTTLGRGTLTSIILVMTVLPQFLLLGDALIERTAITLTRNRKQRFNNGVVRLDGHIRGHVSGFVDGEIKGVIRGSVDALIESKYQEREVYDDETEHQ
ncbi:RND family transporter [uncultured Pseudoflavonifractor sp.]|uniref:efflux RND transporter permease subunit n=1 Tax=uncultured Pseudoflavonifractor sp. TaxID=1221379 RepID=UPI0025FD8476|nr:MMPL family transporter [uncultured Pseudoflavonifractor sp.]